MAFSNHSSPTRSLRSRGPSDLHESTAYQGPGALDLPMVPSIALDHTGFEDVELPAPTARNASPSQRDSLSARFLSTLSNAQPALARSSSVIHSRARSWATYVAKQNAQNANATDGSGNSNSNHSSPVKNKTAVSPSPVAGTAAPIPPPATDKPLPQAPNKLFGDLFHGESAPVRLGMPATPINEDAEMVLEYRSRFTERPQSRPSKRASLQVQPTPAPQSSRLSWFGRKASTPSPNPLPSPTSTPADEILTLNINNSLFPHGPADPLSPHAFNDLLLNATHLLQRMQDAYKEKCDFITSMQPEMDAQREEVEEAETRARHLKLQLEDMGRCNAEQIRINRELAEQLSIPRDVSPNPQQRTPTPAASHLNADDHDTTPTPDNDLDDLPRRRKRSSATSASDSGFESDADTTSSQRSIAGQIQQFPPRRFPVSPSPSNTSDPRSAWKPASLSRSPSILSTSSASSFSSAPRSNPMGPGGVRLVLNSSAVAAAHSSEGGYANAVVTLEKLRLENRHLKCEVDALRGGLQGCIEFLEQRS